ncbi:DUF7859 family protein [Halocalculus aciditolerans]|uniref:Uncharacterized protein n=1 Tax=Halocalculus aciditolerans TaxID=1383812 RepID=A0A830EZT2_9EURY|nr:hypothetical protein GCM10009039_01380 [Halocalculus aciditolerans]
MDPVAIALIVVFLAFVFFCYLMIRRTLLSFREGFEDTQK